MVWRLYNSYISRRLDIKHCLSCSLVSNASIRFPNLNSVPKFLWITFRGEVTVIATARRKNHDKNALEYQIERGHLADLSCKINQQEVVCGLACGGPHKYDLTKWESDEYHLPRMLKDTLDDMLENCRSRNIRASNLYTIGIQVRFSPFLMTR